MNSQQRKMRRILTQLTARWLICRTSPRALAMLIMALAMLASGATVLGLTYLRIGHLALLGGAAALMGYAMHELLRGLWLVSKQPVERTELLHDDLRTANADVPGESDFDDWVDHHSLEVLDQCAVHAESLVAFWIALTVLGVTFVCVYAVYHAPWFFAKLLVEGGIVRHRLMPPLSRARLFLLPVCHTWGLALFLPAYSALVGWTLQLLK